MKILVTGAKGQLGQDVVRQFKESSHEVIAISRDELDLSLLDEVASHIANYNADWVINCAAYTHVDKAEENPELAFTMNRDAAKEIARGVSFTKGKLLHVSTDYVFDGKSSCPYEENDKENPLSAYGRSKLEGENEVKKILPDAIVLRTSWVFGEHGNNFVKTVLKMAAENKELRIVNDQIGSLTWTVDISKTIARLIDSDESGMYHFSSEGEESWYDVAVEIVKAANQLGYEVITENVLPISSSEYPTLAVRPAYSVLSNEKIKNIMMSEMPDWKNSLYSMMKIYKYSDK